MITVLLAALLVGVAHGLGTDPCDVDGMASSCVAEGTSLLQTHPNLGLHKRSLEKGSFIEADSAHGLLTSYVSLDGSDENDGSEGAPFNSIQKCVDQAILAGPGARCLIRGGNYRLGESLKIAGAHGTPDAPIMVAAFPGDSVTFDGTVDLSGGWTKDDAACTEGGCWVKDVPAGVQPWALFVDGQMQTNARWPNAFLHDWSVFDAARWGHCHKNSTYHGPKEYGAVAESMIVDNTVRCTSPLRHSACAHSGCVAHLCHPDANFTSLGESGLNATGASLIVNNAHWLSYASTVRHHAPGSNFFSYMPDPGWKNGKFIPERDIYYLENKLEFLDAPTEWFFDKASSRLYLKTLGDADPNTMPIAGRVQDYAVKMKDVSNFKIKGIRFFATSLVGINRNWRKYMFKNLTLDTLSFTYAGGQKRMLGDMQTGQVLTLWPSYNRTDDHRILIFNSTFYGIDTIPLWSGMSGFTVSNCQFHYIDWSSVCVRPPKDFDEDWGIVYSSGFSYGGNTFELFHAEEPLHNIVERSTFLHNGASEGVQAKKNLIARLNRFGFKYSLQNDGAAFQSGGRRPWEKGGVAFSRNWVHDTSTPRNGKWGLRFDRVQSACTGRNDSSVNAKTWGFGGTMMQNVLWNTKGISVKGNSHTIVNNLAVWNGGNGGDDAEAGLTGHGGANIYNYIDGICGCTTASCKLQSATCCVQGDSGTFENKDTLLAGNAFDAPFGVSAGTPHYPDTKAMDEWLKLPRASLNSGGGVVFSTRDPRNLDFRAKRDSIFEHLCIGPYAPVGAGEEYWIGGHQAWRASSPIPPSGSETVKPDADLMFQPGLGAVGHKVYAGHSEISLGLIATLAEAQGKFLKVTGLANIASPPAQLMTNGSVVFWRVDALNADGSERPGDLWNFTVNPAVYVEEMKPWSKVGEHVAGTTCTKLSSPSAAVPDGSAMITIGSVTVPATSGDFSIESMKVCVDFEAYGHTLGDWQLRMVVKGRRDGYFKRLKNNRQGGFKATTMVRTCFVDGGDFQEMGVEKKARGKLKVDPSVDEPFTGTYTPFDKNLLEGFRGDNQWGKLPVPVHMAVKDHNRQPSNGGTLSWDVTVCFREKPAVPSEEWPAKVPEDDCPWYSGK